MTEVSSAQAATAIRKARGALARYRVMAIVTGCMLLLLTASMIVKYGFGEWLGFDVAWAVDLTRYVGIVHGWVYVVYLGTVLQLWSTMRWGWGRLVTMVLAGVVPAMSFVVERRVHADGQVKLDGLAQRYDVVGA